MKQILQKLGAVFAMLATSFGVAQASDVTVSIDLSSKQYDSDGTTVLTAFGINESGTVVASDATDALVVISGTDRSSEDISHGYLGSPTITFSTANAFKVTIGGCQYGSNTWTVKKDDATLNTFSSSGTCYHNDATSVGTYSYNSYSETASSFEISGGNYMPYLSITFVDPVQEKLLYSTDFTDWDDCATTTITADEEVSRNTKYSHETIAFTINGCTIYSKNEDSNFSGKSNGWEGGYICAQKESSLSSLTNQSAYIYISKLASVTKLKFRHGVTGGSDRGWKLESSVDNGDTWVTESATSPATKTGTDVELDINKTNVQFRFTNLSTGNYAYLMDLYIYGEVDMSTTPALSSITINGTTYEAADYFDEDNDGNMAASFEIAQSATMISSENPVTYEISNGTVDEAAIVYTSTGEGSETVGTVTIPVVADETTVNYVATVTYKQNVTLTYVYDGETIGTQTIEQDATISEFAYNKDSEGITVEDGYAFRGWFVSESGNYNRKYETSDVISENTTLYGIATEIETATASARFVYNLTNKYFYEEDHEVFGNKGGSFYNTTHGWVFKSGEYIEIPVAGDAVIMLNLCLYSGGNPIQLYKVTDNGDEPVASLETDKGSSDAAAAILTYTGDATTLKLVFNGTSYLHKLTVANTADNPIEANEANWYIVDAGNTNHFLTTLMVACANSSDSRTYIFLPNGTYDLGETVLTSISGSNISIIGESTDGTIIKNAPDVSAEGIGTTATLYNTSSDLYLQDLTLQNDLDYYNSGSAGRAVTLQDKGSNTICKNVKLVSYQDTYYSNKDGSNFYWETSEIQGTVDFLCGGGLVIYNQVDIVVRPRTESGKGECTICAPNGSDDNGYYFFDCAIENQAESFNLGRAWNNAARAIYLNTVLKGDASDKLIATHFTLAGMNVLPANFYEYGTVDENGTAVDPNPSTVTFTYGTESNTYDILLTAEQAEAYTISGLLGDWDAPSLAAQLTAPTVTLADGVATWEAVEGAIAYAVYVDGVFTDIITETTYTATGATEVAVRAANSMGGFCSLGDDTSDAISETEAADKEAVSTIIYNLAGQKLAKLQRGLNIVRTLYSDGSVKAKRVLVK